MIQAKSSAGWQEAGRLFARAIGLLAAFACLAASAGAQEARVEIAPAPYYQGQPIELHVVATQFEEDPTPEVGFDPAPGVSLRFVGVSPSSSTSISIVNGRMTRVHEVSFTYRYELTSQRVGPIDVPVFRVRQGATQRETRSFAIEIGAVPTSDEFGISVVLPEGAIFVGQKVPVVIEVRFDQSAVQDVVDYRVQIPLFEVAGLRFIDSQPVGANAQIQVATASGGLNLQATSEEKTVGGRPSLVLRAERTLVAQKPGRIEAAAPSLSVERGTRYRQDLFGGRRAVQTRRTVSAGRAVRIEVAEVPAQGRPASFAGAVGSDFSLEVTADRSVVQLGEPIELAFHLRGHGDLSSAGLPDFAQPGQLEPGRFRLPDEAPAGVIDGDGKRFRSTVRVLDAGVREIPALAYSWFDAQTRRFETVRSQPIALSVGAARVVGADAVSVADPGAAPAPGTGDEGAGAGESPEAVVAGAADAPSESDAALRAGAGSGATSGGDVLAGSLAERAANLALEQDPARVLRSGRASASRPLAPVVLYAVGAALLAAAFVDRRRRAVDPALRRRLAHLDAAQRAVEAALAPGASEAAGNLGRALRELVAAQPDEASSELDALVAECDALRFAPDAAAGGKRTVPEDLAARARALIEAKRAAAHGRKPR